MIEYSSNYSGTAGSLWFYSEGEATNLKVNITDTGGFKCLKDKAKLIGDTVGQPTPNGAY